MEPDESVDIATSKISIIISILLVIITWPSLLLYARQCGSAEMPEIDQRLSLLKCSLGQGSK